MSAYNWAASLQSPTGFTLDYDQLSAGYQLGFLTTNLDDSRVKIRSVSYQGGRNRELDALPPATATIVFDNRDGLFSPNNTASPYYGLIFPGKQIVLRYVYDVGANLSFQVFSGQTVAWTFDFDVNGDAIATVAAKDSLGSLAGVVIPSTSVPKESSGARFARICRLAGLNDAQFYFETGSSVFAADTIEGDALQLVQEVVFQEQGYVTVLYSGEISFIGRNWFQEPAAALYIFNNNEPITSGFVSPYQTLSMVYSDDSIVNSVTTTSALGTATSINSSSVTQYGKVSKQYETSYSTFLEQENFADYISTTYGNPQFRPLDLTVSIDNLLASGVETPFVGLREYGSLARVVFDAPGTGGDIDTAYVISSWGHSATPASYTLTIGFEPLTFQNIFRLDDFEYGSGQLDTGILAF
jgi:hypothetical protein